MDFQVRDLRDRVVIMLLHEQVVREEQVRAAWEQWREMTEAQVPVPLWRVLAIHAGVDAERVFQEAARVYAFDQADLSSTYSVAQFIREHRGDFTEDDWARMAHLSVLPIRLTYERSEQAHWTFATYDPAHPSINQFLNDLDVGELSIRYAPLMEVEAVLHVVFPDQADAWAHLKPALAPDPPEEEDPAAPIGGEDEASDASITPKTLLNVFEEVLVNTVRKQVKQVYLVPNAKRAIEVHFLSNGQLHHWATVKRIPAEVLMGFMKDRVIKTHTLSPGAAPCTIVRRWIDGQQVKFRVEISSTRQVDATGNTEVVRITTVP